MQLLTLDKRQSTRLFWGLAAGFAAVGLLTAEQDDPVVVGVAILLGVACLYPFFFWMLGSAPGLPIWPVFALITGANSVLPMLQDAEALAVYSSERVVMGAATTMMFLVVGTAVWLSISARPQKTPARVLMIARQRSELILLLFIASGIFYHINVITGWIEFPGNTMPVVRSLTTALSSMGVFVLAFYGGRGLLKVSLSAIFLGLTGFYVLLCCTSLMLAAAIVPVALATLGYMLGSGRLPWKTFLSALVAISVLHAGKAQMRDKYWGGGGESTGAPEAGGRLTLTGIPQFFTEWITHGIEELGGIGGVLAKEREEARVASAFERAGILHMLLLVQEKTPGEVPFFAGATYAPIPRLLVPRFINDQKGFSHEGNVMLSVNYGLQTVEGISSTSIYWGLVPEAYANFGYAGVVALAVSLGAFYAWVSRLTVGVPMTSLRFVIGLLIMGAATKADTMGVYVTQQFQGVVAVSLASMMLMKSQRNPFAADAANGGLQDYGTTGRSGRRTRLKGPSGRGLKGPRDQGANGLETGMPAPGVLTGLIEGERPEVADQRLKDEETKSRSPLLRTEPKTKSQMAHRQSVEHGAGPVEYAGPVKLSSDSATSRVGHSTGQGAKQLAADGGVVRTMPIRMPKRVAAWMPKSLRRQVLAEAARSAAEAKLPKAN